MPQPEQLSLFDAPAPVAPVLDIHDHRGPLPAAVRRGLARLGWRYEGSEPNANGDLLHGFRLPDRTDAQGRVWPVRIHKTAGGALQTLRALTGGCVACGAALADDPEWLLGDGGLWGWCRACSAAVGVRDAA